MRQGNKKIFHLEALCVASPAASATFDDSRPPG